MQNVMDIAFRQKCPWVHLYYVIKMNTRTTGNPRGPPEIISWQCLAVCIDLNRKFSSWEWQFDLRYYKKLIIAKFILIFLFTF